ncbi:MAG: DUF350 domain-containing protein [Candidatus Latescibacteria bacterium]|nr:DUF350 domain-containing protein [Candidatus Latescibacterota bacterium]
MIEVTTIQQTLTFLGLNLAYAVVALIVSVVALILIDRYLFTQIDFIAEIREGNIAASIFYSVILLFVGLVVATALN